MLETGTRIDRFEILGHVGTGGMGEVYRALDTRLDREVAVKILLATAVGSPDRLARFEQEAKAAGRLNHPNVLALYEIGSHDGAPYLVTELLQGRTLDELITEGPVAERKALDYARQAARGLAAAHARGIIHRDVKPANLFVTDAGRLKILDFGLAKLTEVQEQPELSRTVVGSASPETTPGVVMGTVGYMAPEQVRGRPADHRSDIFSLGVVLYQMLTGRRPFEAETSAETMTAILRADPPELTELKPDLAPGLDRVVRHCLEKNPDERYQSARDLAFALEGHSTGSGPAVGVREPVTRGSRRSAWLVALAALLAVAAFVAGRWLATPANPSGGLRWTRQTFERGNVLRAGFGPDGKTIVYSAAWRGRPGELFLARTDTPGSTPFGLGGVDLLAVSSKGELAILLKEEFTATTTGAGVLARVPLTGGTPRELLRDVIFADWGPDGKELAVSRFDGKPRIEYPIGTVIHEGFARIVRVSPDGNRVAAVLARDGKETVDIFDREGLRRTLVTLTDLGEGLQWTPNGNCILFTTGEGQVDATLREVDMRGNVRVLDSSPDPLLLHDVAPDGRILVERESYRNEMIFGTVGGAELDVTWLDGSLPTYLSDDGGSVLFEELYTQSQDIYVRGTDGTPAVLLGEGEPWELSPDGQWVLAGTIDPPLSMFLLPTGAGEVRPIDTGNIRVAGGGFLDGERIAFLGTTDPDSFDSVDVYVLELPDGEPRLIVANLEFGSFASAPDGLRFARKRFGDEELTIHDESGPTRTIDDLEPNHVLLQWSEDGRWLYLHHVGTVPARIARYDLETETLEPWLELMPDDPTGVVRIDRGAISRDGRSYVYSPFRIVSSALYVIERTD